MRTAPRTPRYSRKEEIVSTLSHGLGAVLAVVGLAVLMAFAALRGNAWHVVTCSVYGSTLILVYVASTLYHAVSHRRLKHFMRFLDQAAIYLLIAGTYTPFTLVTLRGPLGWTIFVVIWTMALIGIVWRATNMHRWPIASEVLYIAMGWLGVIALKPLVSEIAPAGMVLVVLGGVTYTVGVAFYAWERLPYNHAVWHLFVLAGSACQFFAVLFYVIPLAAPA